MATLIRTVTIDGGEINVYQDADGYHAERWDEARQWVSDQSGDCATADEAIQQVIRSAFGE